MSTTMTKEEQRAINMATANTIRQQLGNKALYMMGASNLVAIENGIQFDFKGCKKWRRMKIVHNAMDLYDITFIYWRGTGAVTEQTLKDNYAEMLRGVIEDHTGLYLCL